jgi:hypothetical protein
LKNIPLYPNLRRADSAVESPIDAVAVHAAIPCPAFPARRLEIRDSSGAKALPREDADFDFRLVESASVGGGEVNRESTDASVLRTSVRRAIYVDAGSTTSQTDRAEELDWK